MWEKLAEQTKNVTHNDNEKIVIYLRCSKQINALYLITIIKQKNFNTKYFIVTASVYKIITLVK